MPEVWTGKMVGKMHVHRVTYQELGNELGVSKAYVCQILNGVRKPKGIRKRMESALDAVLERRKRDAETAAGGEETARA